MNHRLLNKYLFLFGVGGLLYILIELIWRGRSHWTMFLLGGICFVFLGLINEILPWQMPLWQQILIGAVGITTLEFLTGYSGSVVKTKIQAFYNEPISVAELGRCPR